MLNYPRVSGAPNPPADMHLRASPSCLTATSTDDAARPMLLEWGRLLSPASRGYKTYILPPCKHDNDQVYPHNEIKSVNTKFKCISDIQSRNICMRYRMRVMLSGDVDWAQRKTDNCINVQYFAYEVSLRYIDFLKNCARVSRRELNQEQATPVNVDAADDIDFEKITPLGRGDLLDEIAKTEFFETWESYQFLGQFLSQAESGEESELDEMDPIDPEILSFVDALSLLNKIETAKKEIQRRQIWVESGAASVPRGTAGEDEDSSTQGMDLRHLIIEGLARQSMGKLGTYAADGDHKTLTDEHDALWLQFNFSDEGLKKLAVEGVAYAPDHNFGTSSGEHQLVEKSFMVPN